MDAILKYHVRFAFLMAQRIEDASNSQDNLICDSPEARELAEDINNASSLLSINVHIMTSELESFVSILKEMKVTLVKRTAAPEKPASGFTSVGSGTFLEQIVSFARTEVVDSLMQNLRRGRFLRALTP